MISMTSSSSAVNIVALATLTAFDRGIAIADFQEWIGLYQGSLRGAFDFISCPSSPLGFLHGFLNSCTSRPEITNAEKLDGLLRASWPVVVYESIHRAAEHRLHCTTQGHLHVERLSTRPPKCNGPD
jgi:hypothetical protein